MILKIRNRETGEIEYLVRDVRHIHHAWVHAQCGTESESDLEQMLDQIDQNERAQNPERENEAGIFVSVASAEAHLAGIAALRAEG